MPRPHLAPYGRQKASTRGRRPSSRPPRPERRPDRARRADPPLHRLRAPQGELVLHRRRRVRRPDPGGPDRPLQGCPRLPLRQGDVFPELRRALHHPSDHHGDQGRDPLQALAAQHLRLVQPDTGRPGRVGLHARRRAPWPGVDDPAICAISTEELQSLVFVSAPASRRPRATRSASTWRGCRTKRWPRSSAATRRRSTTRYSE